MFVFSSVSRHIQTTIPCRICNTHLEARRTCHEATLFCTTCNKGFTIQEYTQDMDSILEDWLENLHCNRI